jgi:hypothetical protein
MHLSLLNQNFLQDGFSQKWKKIIRSVELTLELTC